MQGEPMHALSTLHVLPGGQSASCRHSTQLPAPSHTWPPLSLQVAPAAAGAVPGSPAGSHVPTRQGLVGDGTLLVSRPIMDWPMPSQMVAWQSAGTSLATTV